MTTASLRNNPHGRRVPTIGTLIPNREDRDWVTTSELVAEASISYRQADYWTRTRLLQPLDEPLPGTGIIRRFDQQQVQRARILADLIDAGIALTTCRLVIDQLQTDGHAHLGALDLHLTQHTASTGAPA
jgi:DNA-binding transcriptional MerR regulator